MIRFCDKEVCCVAENEMDRQQILNYFLDGHRGETICALDIEGKFMGSITYDSLLGKNLDEAVCRDSLVLDETIWEEGRKCFRRRRKQSVYLDLVPVVDREKNLLCFAYQDSGADRELRMLDELSEHKSAAGFRDVFPEYDHVTVYGCNELAWYFVLYLRKAGIPFNISGAFWGFFSEFQNTYGKQAETLDYKNLEIYAEGTSVKEETPEQRQSVSAEFECIDKIYEKNIAEGIIADSCGDLEYFLGRLRGKPAAILGTGRESLYAYDFLLGEGIDICCFVSDTGDRALYGKCVLQKEEALEKWDDIVFIQADKKYSAWGFGETDVYHYMGCRRNRRFFLLQDYTEAPEDGIRNVLKCWIEKLSGRLVLTGDLWMCLSMERALADDVQDGAVVFCDILERYADETINMHQIDAEEINKTDACLLLLPMYYGSFIDQKRQVSYRKELQNQHKEALQRYGIESLTEYLFEDAGRMKLDKLPGASGKSVFRPQKIILGAIHYCSGNVFFSGILDSHPDIIKMRETDGFLSCNLYAYCTRLAMAPAGRILPLFWKLYEEENHRQDICEFPERARFDRCMEKLLAEKESYTPQELFVILHLAYAAMMGMKIKNISEMTIYWEPHSVPRNLAEKYAEWLGGAGEEGYIVNIVRNAYIRAGSALNGIDARDVFQRFKTAVCFPDNRKEKEYSGWKKVEMKFENLKQNPREELQIFCDGTGTAWSDLFLDVQSSWNGVTGFDMTPVYRTWEQYFSSFDRFRICLLTGPWQKKYGYPYINSLDYSRKEQEEMFRKKFRFEENWEFQNEELELFFLRWRTGLIRECLLEVRRRDSIVK